MTHEVETEMQVQQLSLQEVDKNPGVEHCRPWFTKTEQLLIRFKLLAYAKCTHCSPSSDHLLCLIKLNVVRAMETLTVILGMSPAELMEDNVVSPFSGMRPGRWDVMFSSLPGSLSPTILQRTVPHHPWVDTLPIPRMGITSFAPGIHTIQSNSVIVSWDSIRIRTAPV
jgi:hypothetical protein